MKLFTPSPSDLLSLFSLQCLLLRAFTFHRSLYLIHLIVIRLVLVLLFLLVLRCQKPCVLTKFTDSALPFLLVLSTQFGSLVTFVVGITVAEIVRGVLFEFGNVRRNRDRFVSL